MTNKNAVFFKFRKKIFQMHSKMRTSLYSSVIQFFFIYINSDNSFIFLKFGNLRPSLSQIKTRAKPDNQIRVVSREIGKIFPCVSQKTKTQRMVRRNRPKP